MAQSVLDMPTHYIEPGSFNAFSFIDATHYELCDPGSGAASDEDCAPRRQGWHTKQIAWHTACQRGMEASCKVLTRLLPKGMTAAVCGPTSGRRNDLAMLRWSAFDYVLHDMCVLEHQYGNLCATHGDDIFAGCWHSCSGGRGVHVFSCRKCTEAQSHVKSRNFASVQPQ